MSSPAILLLAASAVAFIAVTGKKKRPKTLADKAYRQPKQAIPKIYGHHVLPPSTAGTESPTDWQQRQEALTALSQVEINLRDGSSIRLCSRCDPRGITGEADANTINAVKAFQALVGLEVTGEWGLTEDKEMHRMLQSIMKGHPIECDPLTVYPEPFACFASDVGFYLGPVAGIKGEEPIEPVAVKPDIPMPESPSPQGNGETPEWGVDDILVADADCNYMLHVDDEFFHIQQRMIIEYALDGWMDEDAANEIHERLMSHYLPLCLTLGYAGVGDGVKKWWNKNVSHVFMELKGYELVPELLEEDAIKYGLL